MIEVITNLHKNTIKREVLKRKRDCLQVLLHRDLAKQLVQVPQITNERHLIKRTRPTQNMVIKANGNRDLELCHINGFHNHHSEQSRSARGSPEKHILQHLSPLKSMTVWSECSKTDYLTSAKHTWLAGYMYVTAEYTCLVCDLWGKNTVLFTHSSVYKTHKSHHSFGLSKAS